MLVLLRANRMVIYWCEVGGLWPQTRWLWIAIDEREWWLQCLVCGDIVIADGRVGIARVGRGPVSQDLLCDEDAMNKVG